MCKCLNSSRWLMRLWVMSRFDESDWGPHWSAKCQLSDTQPGGGSETHPHTPRQTHTHTHILSALWRASVCVCVCCFPSSRLCNELIDQQLNQFISKSWKTTDFRFACKPSWNYVLIWNNNISALIKTDRNMFSGKVTEGDRGITKSSH